MRLMQLKLETKQNQNCKQLSQAKPSHTPSQERGGKASRMAVSYYLWLTWTDPKVTLEAGLRSQVRNGLGNRVFKGGATQQLGGAVAPAKKKKKFPLDYEEKINRPPQHWTAGLPTHFSPILPALNQKLGTPSNYKK